MVCRYRGSRRSKRWSLGKIIKNYNSMEYNTALHTSLRVLRLEPHSTLSGVDNTIESTNYNWYPIDRAIITDIQYSTPYTNTTYSVHMKDSRSEFVESICFQNNRAKKKKKERKNVICHSLTCGKITTRSSWNASISISFLQLYMYPWVQVQVQVDYEYR